MKHELRFTQTNDARLTELEQAPHLKNTLKQVYKTLGYLETNLRTPSLETHEMQSLSKRYKRKIFEAYVQDKTPGAWRVFWHYGDDETDDNGNRIPIITVIAITPHPD